MNAGTRVKIKKEVIKTILKFLPNGHGFDPTLECVVVGPYAGGYKPEKDQTLLSIRNLNSNFEIGIEISFLEPMES